MRDITMMYVDWADALNSGSSLAPMRLRPGSIEGLTQEAH